MSDPFNVNNNSHTTGLNSLADVSQTNSPTGIKQNLTACFEKIKGFFKKTFTTLINKFTTERKVDNGNYNFQALANSQNDISNIETKISNAETELKTLKNSENPNLNLISLKEQALENTKQQFEVYKQIIEAVKDPKTGNLDDLKQEFKTLQGKGKDLNKQIALSNENIKTKIQILSASNDSFAKKSDNIIENMENSSSSQKISDQ